MQNRNAVTDNETRQTAELWHWRARTAVLEEDLTFELPAGWASFEQLVTRLRKTREWDFVEREIDIRLAR